MRSTAWFLAALTAAIVAGGCARWRDSENGTQAAAAGSADESFIREAGAGNATEAELGRLAADRASSPEVRTFGQRMAGDHAAANAELRQIAAARGITISDTPPKDKRKHIDELSRLSGQEFDRRYMAMMVEKHRQTIQKFEDQARNGKDPAVRDWASRTLPTVREHLRMAEDIAQRIGAM